MTMPGGLVIKCNLTSSDRLAHFSTQWTNHWHGKSVGWLTDLQLVGRNGAGWGRVGVHRAVIVPLCPLIAVVGQDVMREDPVIILPQFPVELLEAFASLIYTGSTSITAHVNVVSMLELMNIVGLKMPVDRLYVIRKEPSDVEIICYKNPSSLEISMVNSATPHRHAAPAPSARRTLEIIRTPKNGKILDHVVSKTVQIQTSSKQKTRAERMREIVGKYVGDGQASHEDDTSWMEHGNASERFDTVPIDIKFECEDAVEYLYDVAEVKSTKKRKWNRKSETLQKLSHSCYYCDFKCRFVKDLQEHCDLFHSEKEFSCQKCNFKTSGIAYMKYHMRKKHIEAGEFNCDICDLKVNSKRKLMTHKARCSKIFGSKRRKSINVKSKDYQEISFLTNSDNQPFKEKVVNKDDLEASLELNGIKAVKEKNEQNEYEHLLEKLNDTSEVTLQKNFGEETNDGNNDESSEFKKSNVERLNKNFTVSSEKDTIVQTEDVGSGILENIECTLKEIPLNDKKKTDAEGSQVNVENVAMICSPNSNSANKDDNKKTFKIASLKEVIKTSNDVIGFQCNASNCSKVSRVYKTRTATSALNMLEDHHAKTHLDVKDKFSYTVLYKEGTEDRQTARQQDVEETDPLSILKKLKKSHIKPTTEF